MKALQYTRKALEGVAVAICVIIFFGVIFLAGGGMAILAGPDNCTGTRDLPVGEATTFWQLAEKHYPYDDPRVVTDKMLEMNNRDYNVLHHSTIKSPVDC